MWIIGEDLTALLTLATKSISESTTEVMNSLLVKDKKY
jgi:hypothetical protein